MAKGKGKKASNGGPHKNHGPKKKMWHYYDSTTRLAFGQAGILKKTSNHDSFMQSMQDRGLRNIPSWLEAEMYSLSTDKEKKEWFENLKNRNIAKEDRDREEKAKAKQQVRIS